MSETLQRYFALEKKLAHLRWIHQGFESKAEDAILDEMDEVWWHLTESERELLNQKGPISLIRSGVPIVSRHQLRDVDVWRFPGSTCRKEVA